MPCLAMPAVALALLLTASGGHAQAVPDDAAELRELALAERLDELELRERAVDELERRALFRDGFHCGVAWLTFTGALIESGSESVPFLTTHTYRKSAIRKVSSSTPGGPNTDMGSRGFPTDGFVLVDTGNPRLAQFTVSADTYRRTVLCLN